MEIFILIITLISSSPEHGSISRAYEVESIAECENMIRYGLFRNTPETTELIGKWEYHCDRVVTITEQREGRPSIVPMPPPRPERKSP